MTQQLQLEKEVVTFKSLAGMQLGNPQLIWIYNSHGDVGKWINIFFGGGKMGFSNVHVCFKEKKKKKTHQELTR